MVCYFIRHGITKGNLENRYIGTTDDSLCKEGINQIITNIGKGMYPQKVDLVIHTGMKRTLETAKLIFNNNITMIEEKDFRECNFGKFENKNYIELSGDSEYQSWIDSNGTLPFPNGESREQFIDRCQKAFVKIIDQHKECERIALCVHGGTIMALLSSFDEHAQNNKNDSGKTYYDYHVKNGECISKYVYNIQKEQIILKDIV